MRIISKLILIIGVFVMTGCSEKSNDLVVGGLYITQNDNGFYSVSKILALDEFAAHIRMYSDEFKTKPNDLNSADLNFLIGHAPMAKEGFLMDKPVLLKVEKVSKEELEGYNYYLDAMKNQ
ncbi:hypothetical protein [Aquimarina algiphila]|uniref:hypothetical protein n=1 Tax=Aquimarina algiphila TaxID=2047982 RepID=UPI002493CF7E|nr:hypothetical protein [Aquimarina algiphila]